MRTLIELKRAGWLGLALILGTAVPAALAQQPTNPSYPVYKVTNTPAPTAASPAPAATPAPPPSAPAERSAADLEKLVAPIALYPDSLIATILPASVYPLEIVQAARFVANTNNLANLDAQPWDENVKAVARVPAVIQKMNDDLTWTMELGETFLAQDKAVMDAIQNLRAKAQKAGTLQTTPQQVVTVTNMVIEKTVEQQVVVVTNTIVQIQPSNPQVVYVPTYNPYTVYYPPPTYVYNPYAPLVTFGAGIAVGAIIANNCDWHHGGCYHGDVNVDVDRNVNRNVNRNENINRGANTGARTTQQKWQPDQSRLSKSGVAHRRKHGPQRGGARLEFRRCPGLDGQRWSTSFHRNCRRTTFNRHCRHAVDRRSTFLRHCRHAALHWHALGQSAHRVSNRKPSRSLGQHLAVQTEPRCQPPVFRGQRVQRGEQRIERSQL